MMKKTQRASLNPMATSLSWAGGPSPFFILPRPWLAGVGGLCYNPGYFAAAHSRHL
jgi:hypothetical protein